MNLNNIEINRANKSDMKNILSIEKLCFHENHFPITTCKQLSYLIASPTVEFLVLRDNDKIIQGTGIIFFRKNSYTAKINSIAIHPDAQRYGYGKLLIAAFEQSAIKKGCKQISLEVRNESLIAINFYIKQNYKQYKTLPGYYPDGVDGIMMKKTLFKK